MKKIKIIVMIVLFFLISQNTYWYDQTFSSVKLRFGKSYIFTDTFHSWWYLTRITWAETTFVPSSVDPWFEYSDEISKRTPASYSWYVEATWPDSSLEILRSKTFTINYLPAEWRQKDNIEIVYNIFYKNKVKWVRSGIKSHTEYQPYEITWCWDWILDNYYDVAQGERIVETCDSADPSKTGWGAGWCDAQCLPIEAEPAACISLDVDAGSWDYTCTWNGLVTSYELFKNWTKVSTNSTGTFNVVDGETYNFECRVNWETTAVNACKDTTKIDLTPDCTSLEVNNASWDYTCTWNSIATSYRIFKDWVQISTNATWTFDIDSDWVYNFACLVDWESLPADVECRDTVTVWGLVCDATVTWTQSSPINSSTSGLCAITWQEAVNFNVVQSWKSYSYTWNCKDANDVVYTGWDCSANYRDWWSAGWDPYRCNDVVISWNNVQCIWNQYTEWFWVVCNTASWSLITDVDHFSGTDWEINNLNYASFNCWADLGTPKCYVYSRETEDTSRAWRTSSACTITDNPFCWDGHIDPGEECERAIDSEWNLWDWPGKCNPNTCTYPNNPDWVTTTPWFDWNLTTEPAEGEIGFVWIYDIILGHKQNLSRLNNGIYIWNNSDYTFGNGVFDWICIAPNNIKNQKNTWDSLDSLTNWFDNNKYYCKNINTKFYPDQKIYFNGNSILENIIANKNKINTWNDYEDNKLVVTIRTKKNTGPFSKVLNWSSHLSGKFTVRVSNPAIQSTSGTSYTEDWVNTQEVVETNINLANSTTWENNNDVWVWVQSSSSNTTTSNEVVADGETYSSGSTVIDTVVDNTETDFINYNGLDNVFIKTWNVNSSDIKLSDITESTTYIIDWWYLNIDENIDSDYNIAFIVKNGWDIIVKSNVTQIKGTYIVLGDWEIKWESSAEQLLVNGSIYWDIAKLIENRYYVNQDWWSVTFGTLVSFSSNIFQKPAPLVSQFISTYLSSDLIAQ